MKDGELAKSPLALGTGKVRWCLTVSGSARQPGPRGGEVAVSPARRDTWIVGQPRDSVRR